MQDMLLSAQKKARQTKKFASPVKLRFSALTISSSPSSSTVIHHPR